MDAVPSLASLDELLKANGSLAQFVALIDKLFEEIHNVPALATYIVNGIVANRLRDRFRTMAIDAWLRHLSKVSRLIILYSKSAAPAMTDEKRAALARLNNESSALVTFLSQLSTSLDAVDANTSGRTTEAISSLVEITEPVVRLLKTSQIATMALEGQHSSNKTVWLFEKSTITLMESLSRLNRKAQEGRSQHLSPLCLSVLQQALLLESSLPPSFANRFVNLLDAFVPLDGRGDYPTLIRMILSYFQRLASSHLEDLHRQSASRLRSDMKLPKDLLESRVFQLLRRKLEAVSPSEFASTLSLCELQLSQSAYAADFLRACYAQSLENHFNPVDFALWLVAFNFEDDFDAAAGFVIEAIHSNFLQKDRGVQDTTRSIVSLPGLDSYSPVLLKLMAKIFSSTRSVESAVIAFAENLFLEAFIAWPEIRAEIVELCFTSLQSNGRHSLRIDPVVERYCCLLERVAGECTGELVVLVPKVIAWLDIHNLSALPSPITKRIVRSFAALAFRSVAFLDADLTLIRKSLASKFAELKILAIEAASSLLTSPFDTAASIQEEIATLLVSAVSLPLSIRETLWTSLRSIFGSPSFLSDSEHASIKFGARKKLANAVATQSLRYFDETQTQPRFDISRIFTESEDICSPRERIDLLFELAVLLLNSSVSFPLRGRLAGAVVSLSRDLLHPFSFLKWSLTFGLNTESSVENVFPLSIVDEDFYERSTVSVGMALPAQPEQHDDEDAMDIDEVPAVAKSEKFPPLTHPESLSIAQRPDCLLPLYSKFMELALAGKFALSHDSVELDRYSVAFDLMEVFAILRRSTPILTPLSITSTLALDSACQVLSSIVGKLSAGCALSCNALSDLLGHLLEGLKFHSPSQNPLPGRLVQDLLRLFQSFSSLEIFSSRFDDKGFPSSLPESSVLGHLPPHLIEFIAFDPAANFDHIRSLIISVLVAFINRPKIDNFEPAFSESLEASDFSSIDAVPDPGDATKKRKAPPISAMPSKRRKVDVATSSSFALEATLVSFSSQLAKALETGVSSTLLLRWMELLEGLARLLATPDRDSSRSALRESAAIVKSILQTFSIRNPKIVRLLVRFLLEHYGDMALADEMVTACSKPEVSKQKTLEDGEQEPIDAEDIEVSENLADFEASLIHGAQSKQVDMELPDIEIFDDKEERVAPTQFNIAETLACRCGSVLAITEFYSSSISNLLRTKLDLVVLEELQRWLARVNTLVVDTFVSKTSVLREIANLSLICSGALATITSALLKKISFFASSSDKDAESDLVHEVPDQVSQSFVAVQLFLESGLRFYSLVTDFLLRHGPQIASKRQSLIRSRIETFVINTQRFISLSKLPDSLAADLQESVEQLIKTSSEKKKSSLERALSNAKAGADNDGKRKRKPRKQRLRSRNKFIDTFLRYEEGLDDFADLEDFIITKEGQDYESVRYVVNVLDSACRSAMAGLARQESAPLIVDISDSSFDEGVAVSGGGVALTKVAQIDEFPPFVIADPVPRMADERSALTSAGFFPPESRTSSIASKAEVELEEARRDDLISSKLREFQVLIDQRKLAEEEGVQVDTTRRNLIRSQSILLPPQLQSSSSFMAKSNYDMLRQSRKLKPTELSQNPERALSMSENLSLMQLVMDSSDSSSDEDEQKANLEDSVSMDIDVERPGTPRKPMLPQEPSSIDILNVSGALVYSNEVRKDPIRSSADEPSSSRDESSGRRPRRNAKRKRFEDELVGEEAEEVMLAPPKKAGRKSNRASPEPRTPIRSSNPSPASSTEFPQKPPRAKKEKLAAPTVSQVPKESDLSRKIRLCEIDWFTLKYTAHDFDNNAKKTIVLYNTLCLEHRVPDGHFEVPRRLEEVIRGLTEIKDAFPTSNMTLEVGSFEKASIEDCLLAHDAEYITAQSGKAPSDPKSMPLHATQRIADDSSEPMDTFMSFSSWDAALLAAGSVIHAVNLVSDATKACANVFCAVRPPGHHAGIAGRTKNVMSQGYCLLNNIAIGALYAVKTKGYKRVLIFDFDLHHGNGTEEIVANNPNILFVSSHVAKLYPFTGDCGDELGQNIINLPLKMGSRGISYRRKLDHVLPTLATFAPDLVMISAGFDAHEDDPTHASRMQLEDFEYFSQKLKELADTYAQGRLVSVMEGGYNVEALRTCVQAHILELMKR